MTGSIRTNKTRVRGYEHARRRVSGKKDPFYCSARWRTLRRVFLATHPVCADPFGYHAEDGRVVLAGEVDHVIPRALRPDLELDQANLQSLCSGLHGCHSRKTGVDQAVARRAGAEARS